MTTYEGVGGVVDGGTCAPPICGYGECGIGDSVPNIPTELYGGRGGEDALGLVASSPLADCGDTAVIELPIFGQRAVGIREGENILGILRGRRCDK